ncbi:MAG TPA: hypothetical protein VLA89_02865 [Gemmatimonadales bacterium]|nr:hypothetical protein [Gemmatimonadales bacterium]
MGFPYEALASSGHKTIRITYAGSSDEGYIEEIEDKDGLAISDDLTREIEDVAYDLLSDQFGGWEINEGSDGNIELDVANRKATITHSENVVTQHTQTVEVA